jgi:hypothetical protein
MKVAEKIPFNIIVITKQYLISLSIYLIFRLVLFFTEFNRIDGDVELLDILRAFLFGLRFDIVVSGYILILPFVLLSINNLFERDFKIIRIIVFTWINIFFIASFLVCAGNIPYFNQFFSHITFSTFSVIDTKNISFL